MGQKWVKWLEKWGYALMCVLCAGVVLLSALWTRSGDRKETLSMDAARSMDERLHDVQQRQETEQPDKTSRPVSGQVLRSYTQEAVYFPQTGVWKAHLAIDFDGIEEEKVCAMFPGTVTSAAEGVVRICHGDRESVYRGLKSIACKAGDTVSAGDEIGTSGARVPFEGEGLVCVSVYEKGVSVDFATLLP